MSASVLPHEGMPVGWFGVGAPGTRVDDPYPALNHLRETLPVHMTPAGTVRLFRHADVVRLLRETRVGVRTLDGVLPGVDETEFGERKFMLQQDPPNHTRLRRLVSRGFTPNRIKAMESHVQALVDDLLEQALSQNEMDVIADLARPLPATVICQMLGVPLADRDRFTDWTARITHLLVPAHLTTTVRERAFEALSSLLSYMDPLISERRKALGEDLLSDLIRAEEAGDRLSTDELITHAMGLLIAGFETTIGLIGNGVRQLLLHPQELAKLVAEPGLIGSAVEECLRFDGPIPGTLRVLHEQAEFGGYSLAADTPINVSLAAAHRDPRVFEAPDEFRIERDHSAHLAFGGGIHFCLGAHLARLEAQKAIGTLIQRAPRLSLTSDAIEWGESLFRIQARLMVTLR
ncbi:MAG: cytochrome P450 [Myxococcales bacterium]|nr:cytochrome P450 [Myxococcales bacterium]